MRSSRRKGFTLIELLVVIAIIAILIALLVPAVQKVREAAARTQCINNMKQLGVALHNYHGVYKKFPEACTVTTSGSPGNCCASGYGYPNISGLYYLLPYLEQEALYKQFDYVNGAQCCNSGASPYWTGATQVNGTAAATNLPVFMCPSDPNTLIQILGACAALGFNGPLERQGGTNYVFAAGTGAVSWLNALQTGKLTVDLGGLFSPNTKRGVRDVTDGTSNTLAFGEVLWVDHANNPASGNGYGGKPTWANGYFTMNSFSTTGGINATWTCPTVSTPYNLKGPNTTSNVGCGSPRNAALQSFHSGGANVALADGSVRFLSNGISQTTLDAIATRGNNDQPDEF